MDFDDAVIIYNEKSGKKYSEYLKKSLEKGFQRVCTSYDISKLNEIEIKKEFINSCYVIALLTDDYKNTSDDYKTSAINAIGNGNNLKFNKLIRLCKKSIELEKHLMVYVLDDLNLEIFSDLENDENKIDKNKFVYNGFKDSYELTDSVNYAITGIKENMEISINKLCDSKFNLANLYVFLNFLEDASNEYESILELCPEYGNAKNNQDLIKKYELRKKYESKYCAEHVAIEDKENNENKGCNEEIILEANNIETKENNETDNLDDIVHSIKEKLKEEEVLHKFETLEGNLKFEIPPLSELKEDSLQEHQAQNIIEKKDDLEIGLNKIELNKVKTEDEATEELESYKLSGSAVKKENWPKVKPEVKIEIHEQKIDMNEGIPEKEIIRTEKALDDESDIVINSYEDTEQTEEVTSKELWHKTKITPLHSLKPFESIESYNRMEESEDMKPSELGGSKKDLKDLKDTRIIDELKKSIDDENIHDKSMVEHYLEGLMEEIFPKKEDEESSVIEKQQPERIKYIEYDKKEQFNKKCYDEDISENSIVSKKNIKEKDHITSQNHLNDYDNYQYKNQYIKNDSDNEKEYQKLLTKANEYYSSGDYKNAEKNYRKAITMHSNVAEAHNNLGCLLDNLGNLEEAEHEYRQALEVDPQYMKAHNNLATILGHMGRYEEAEVQYNKALELNPDYWEARYNLSMMHASNNEYEQAISEIKKLSKYFRKNGEIKEALQLKKFVKSLKKMAHLESDEVKKESK
ncbi:tetratricopeptide repeat protein [Methanococcus voltae]|uniref:Tetratricopeptide (TPR) repeat protein n=1 Tax=Methanococcus voltae TaxID=2188 RepID=A0A8J7S4T3_METVO|nr:tetratricopeptide repeat protein [Methanococcus voltae]MBP2172675.1 tetratricopeptide (TPR) repeat protein [Methanococcus voltae]MBP2201408.1 tetratricopeptide (TPR) repeat protein [Methanococcus voltae]